METGSLPCAASVSASSPGMCLIGIIFLALGIVFLMNMCRQRPMMLPGRVRPCSRESTTYGENATYGASPWLLSRKVGATKAAERRQSALPLTEDDVFATSNRNVQKSLMSMHENGASYGAPGSLHGKSAWSV
jgi:hypothetical protein